MPSDFFVALTDLRFQGAWSVFPCIDGRCISQGKIVCPNVQVALKELLPAAVFGAVADLIDRIACFFEQNGIGQQKEIFIRTVLSERVQVSGIEDGQFIFVEREGLELAAQQRECRVLKARRPGSFHLFMVAAAVDVLALGGAFHHEHVVSAKEFLEFHLRAVHCSRAVKGGQAVGLNGEPQFVVRFIGEGLHFHWVVLSACLGCLTNDAMRRILSWKNDSFPQCLVGPFELYLKRLDIKGSLDPLLLITDISKLQEQWLLLADK